MQIKDSFVLVSFIPFFKELMFIKGNFPLFKLIPLIVALEIVLGEILLFCILIIFYLDVLDVFLSQFEPLFLFFLS
jgi:hypothetical protein